jgi:hypothetical protein
MKHKSCGGTIRVTHTYGLKDQKFQRGYCDKCRLVFCLETLLTPVVSKGDGARARAQRAQEKTP